MSFRSHKLGLGKDQRIKKALNQYSGNEELQGYIEYGIELKYNEKLLKSDSQYRELGYRTTVISGIKPSKIEKSIRLQEHHPSTKTLIVRNNELQEHLCAFRCHVRAYLYEHKCRGWSWKNY
ncbi:hypothetical protein Glove_586g39 [Diversispora epigaea]|uniref:Uncharacterized protein n=1 Tax=Diversispora epigaea TaxID=1348612 RepID=A0A397GGW5_9GLOM|nr:hypothetical protein Glove_586g39 [Diversispora epigaea]